MTSRPWTFRAAATVVALATATATHFATATAAQADAPPHPGAVGPPRPRRGEGQTRAHDLDGPLSPDPGRPARRGAQPGHIRQGHGQGPRRFEGGPAQGQEGRRQVRVELGREKTDKIFTILVEFGDKTDSRYGGTPGPLHNSIAAPDRRKDNSTACRRTTTGSTTRTCTSVPVRTPSPSRSTTRSSPRAATPSTARSPTGSRSPTTRPVTATTPAAPAPAPASGTWSATAWTPGSPSRRRPAAPRTPDIKADVAEFDQWDRYDFDGDGDFNEADGYIDHFQIVHAGEDESAGGGAEGEDAIWAHRWYAFGSDANGATGTVR
ncbi:Protease OS=Streptomyces fumanus OX=67302 GN=GCM10018772_07670 PE=4 SV=1 [Streptomyces fumanus]